MNVFSTVEDVRQHRWREPLSTWGLVPTMGYLHEGHLSLIRRAKRENEQVGVSIFVNPTQFNNPTDLETYPRNLERDLSLLEDEGVALVWTPTPEIAYPPDFQTYVSVEAVTQPLEGAARPGHFRGVTTVVNKLLNVFQPHRAYFGQKDAQQLAVIQQMVRDLNMNVQIVPCAIVREDDGLAMSSRNANLSPPAREQATCLYRALMAAQSAYENGERDAEALKSTMRQIITAEPLADIDYLSVAHPQTLEELTAVEDRALVSMAVFVDEVRLIDNLHF